MRWAHWLGVLLGAVACGETDKDPPRVPINMTPSACRVGASCTCAGGGNGKVERCVGSQATCVCDGEECAMLIPMAPPIVTTCGGDVLGMWRLHELPPALGRIETSTGGVCPSMQAPDAALPVPLALMDLKPNGVARYLTESSPFTLSWSNSCVTSQSAGLTCSTSVWSNVSSCQLDCDVCSCVSSTRANHSEAAKWQEDAGFLQIAPWGTLGGFAYCVEGNQLQLYSDGLRLVFERVKASASDCLLTDFGELPGCSLEVVAGGSGGSAGAGSGGSSGAGSAGSAGAGGSSAGSAGAGGGSGGGGTGGGSAGTNAGGEAGGDSLPCEGAVPPSTVCDFGLPCGDASDCAGNSCYVPGTKVNPICSQASAKDHDCPSGTICTGSQQKYCFIECEGHDECLAINSAAGNPLNCVSFENPELGRTVCAQASEP